MNYLFMKPSKKRRDLFSDYEYENASSMEEAFWMAVQETKLFAWLP